MSAPTPRTDALAFANAKVARAQDRYVAAMELARALERELAETRDELNRVTCERDGFRHQAARAALATR